jgi:hypothetical protein
VRILSSARRVVALPTRERHLLCLTLVLMAHVRAALSLLPSRTSLRLVRRLAILPDRAPRADRPAPAQLAWAVETASRVVPRATCLTQAVVGKLLLRHFGYDAQLCVGVARSSGGAFYAHAWVEREGRTLIGATRTASFTPLPLRPSTLGSTARVDARR